MVAVDIGASRHRPLARRATRCAAALLLSAGLALAPGVSARAAEPAVDAAPAHASSADPTADASRRRAEEHHRRGLQLYDVGALDRALGEFELAYSISRNYQVLFNIGQLRYRLGDITGARQALERFSSEGGRRIPEARRRDVARQLQELAPHTRPVIGAPLERAPELARPHPASTPLEGLPPKLVIAWTGAAAFTLGAVGTGIATYVSSRHYDEQLRQAVDASPETARDSLDRQRDRVQDLAFATDVLIVAGLSALGLALYMTLSDSAADPAVARAQPGQLPIRVEF